MRGLGDFLDRFVLPLIGAGEVHVGAAIRFTRVAEWAVELERCSDKLEAIDQLRQRAAGALVVRPPDFLFGETELSIMVALHNLLYLSHPESDGVLTTRKQKARVAVACLGLLRAPAATTKSTLLGRHTLILPLFELERRDVDLKWWTGSRRFRGQHVPGRLKFWPRLRNVTEQVRRVPFWEIVSEDGSAAVSELFALSPLTDLLNPARGTTPFAFEQRHLPVLADRELGRAVCYSLAPDLGARAHALGGALLGLFGVPAPRANAPAALPFVQFCLYLHYLHALETPAAGPAPVPAGSLAAMFWALPAACARLGADLVGPPGWDAEASTASAFRAYRERVAHAAGPEAVDAMLARLSSLLPAPSRLLAQSA